MKEKLDPEEIDVLLSEVKRRCNGMLSTSVYRRIYDAAYESGGGSLVEVGTAHAAGTISLALGMRHAGHTGTIYTFDKIVGGSRDAFGGIDENRHIIQSNLDYYDVSDLVNVYIGDISDTYGQVPLDKPISILMLDADGKIDRDFMLFYSRLKNNSAVIIDDVVDVVRCKRVNRKKVIIDNKMKLSFLLLNNFISNGYISQGEIVHGTYFGSALKTDNSEMKIDGILEAYRQLIFTESMLPTASDKMRRGLSLAVRKHYPTFHLMLKQLLNRSTKRDKQIATSE